MQNRVKQIITPVSVRVLEDLRVGDFISISGVIYTGRDAALPPLVQSIKSGQKIIDLEGAVIMHTAVSPAGIAPTTSNKEQIQESIAPLSKAGVRMHIGKGTLSKKTIDALKNYNSIFAVTPPAAALLTSKILSSEVVAFQEEGMEAIHRLEVTHIPGIVAIAHGESLY